MARFKSSNPLTEVSGAGVLSVLKGMEQFRALADSILSKHGIRGVVADKWYLQQAWLDALEEMTLKIGQKTIKIIGRNIPDTAMWPPYIHNIEEALASIDAAYRMNHRNGESCCYIFEKTGEGSGKVRCFSSYPCMMDYGIIEGTAEKFSGGKAVSVEHDPKGPCRQKGGETCVYLVSWK